MGTLPGEFEGDDVDLRRIARENEFADAAISPPRPAVSVSALTPAAPVLPPKDPDKALANVALGMLRLQNWPCQEEDGYRSFKMQVRFKTPTRGVVANDEFRVFAENGVLFFEQLVLELPELPGVPLLEAINEINQYSVAATFFLKADGVYMRHALIPRAKEDTVFSVKTLLQSLRQMYHDRRHALSLLRQVVETGVLEPVVVARAFAFPLTPGNVSCGTLEDLSDLARFSGYCVSKDSRQVYLSRDSIQPDRCPVRLTINDGYIRGFVTMGDCFNGKHHWTLVPPQLRDFIRGALSQTFGGNDTAEIYQRLNLMNQQPGLSRYIVSMRSIFAVAHAVPTDMWLTVEQFKILAERLLDHAAVGTARPKSGLHKLAC